MQLSPCPFCGNAAVHLEATPSAFGVKHFVKCDSCYASGPKQIYENDAATEWNVCRQAVKDSYERGKNAEMCEYLFAEIKQKLYVLKEELKK